MAGEVRFNRFRVSYMDSGEQRRGLFDGDGVNVEYGSYLERTSSQCMGAPQRWQIIKALGAKGLEGDPLRDCGPSGSPFGQYSNVSTVLQKAFHHRILTGIASISQKRVFE